MMRLFTEMNGHTLECQQLIFPYPIHFPAKNEQTRLCSMLQEPSVHLSFCIVAHLDLEITKKKIHWKISIQFSSTSHIILKLFIDSINSNDVDESNAQKNSVPVKGAFLE